jgi:hypothetical protein
MIETLQGMKPEFLLIAAGFAFVTVISLVSVVAEAWRKSRRDAMLFDLKREMLEREMSVEEIERVCRAAPPAALPSTIASGWNWCQAKSRLHPAPTEPGRTASPAR